MLARSLEIPQNFDVTDSGTGKFGLVSGLMERQSVTPSPMLAIPDGIYPEAPIASSLPTAFASMDMKALKPIFDSASAVDFTTASENEMNGVEPDFILGADGQLHPNPEKSAPSADGSLNIQMEGEFESNKQALIQANENQKASVREMIRYFQKNNPGAKIPGEWLDQLEKQPDFPSPSTHQDAPVQMTSPGRSAPSSIGGGGGGGVRGGGGGGGGGRSRFLGGGGGSRRGGGEGFLEERPRGRVELPAPIPGDMRVDGPPTITPEKINEVLKDLHSPAAGLGQHIYDEGVKHGINPAVALAFFVQESTAGTKGVATETNSWGNIKGSGPAGSYKGFRAYNDFGEGVSDWYRLIKEKYLAPQSEGGFGAETLSQIISKYAPSSDGNNEGEYVANVKGMVKGWSNG